MLLINLDPVGDASAVPTVPEPLPLQGAGVFYKELQSPNSG